MPRPGKLEKAQLTELWPGSDNRLQPRGKDGGEPKRVTVQFNPESLKVSFTNQNAGGKQPSGGAAQFVGQGTTKLRVELWFDVQLPLPEGTPDPGGDVRRLTQEVAYFMTPHKVRRGTASGLLPPGIQFQWGTFLFKGTVDSLDETLERFSEDGRPLRAQVALSLSKQDLVFEFGTAGSGGDTPPGGGAPTGTRPMEAAREGDSAQAVAARSGVRDWKGMAAANGIENPRSLPPGTLLDVSPPAPAPPPVPGASPLSRS
jgi:hypothetical protein